MRYLFFVFSKIYCIFFFSKMNLPVDDDEVNTENENFEGIDNLEVQDLMCYELLPSFSNSDTGFGSVYVEPLWFSFPFSPSATPSLSSTSSSMSSLTSIASSSASFVSFESSLIEHMQSPDHDLFYRCDECINDETFENKLEEKGIQKAVKHPYSLKQLALSSTFRAMWPLTPDRTDEIKNSSFYKILKICVERTEAKNLLFRFLIPSGEWVHTAQSILNKIETFHDDNRLFLEARHLRFAPICCCILQRRCIYSSCCYYTWAIDTTSHTQNRYTHCCNGYYFPKCVYFESKVVRCNYTLSIK